MERRKRRQIHDYMVEINKLPRKLTSWFNGEICKSTLSAALPREVGEGMRWDKIWQDRMRINPSSSSKKYVNWPWQGLASLKLNPHWTHVQFCATVRTFSFDIFHNQRNEVFSFQNFNYHCLWNSLSLSLSVSLYVSLSLCLSLFLSQSISIFPSLLKPHNPISNISGGDFPPFFSL